MRQPFQSDDMNNLKEGYGNEARIGNGYGDGFGIVILILLLAPLLILPLQAQDAAARAYNEALKYMNQGQRLFRQAMESTSGGSARADLCGKARREYFQATLKAEEYNKLTGKGDDLLQQIQMGDYEAMKNAPQGTWSPPARDASAPAAPPPQEGSQDHSTIVIIVMIVVGVIGAGAFVVYRVQASSRRAAAAPPASRTSSRRQAAPPPEAPAPRSASRCAPAQPAPRATSSRRAAQPPPSGRQRRR